MKKQSLFCLLVGLSIFPIANPGCSSLHKKDANASASKINLIPSNSFAQTWSNNLKLKDPADELYVREKSVYLYTKGDVVYALDRKGGEVEYAADPQISGGTLRAPLVIGNRVVYPSGSTIEVMNDQGRPVRIVELEKPTRSGAVGNSNLVYIGLDHTGGTGVLARIDLNRQYKVVDWELMTGGAITPTPAIMENVIYCGSEDGRLYAVTPDRLPVWSLPGGNNFFQSQGKFISDIKVDETGVYASNTDSKLYCLDRLTGRIKWQYYSGAPLRTAPVVMQTNVYQYVDRYGIVCIDKANGQYSRAPKWNAKAATQFLSEDDRNVYLRTKDNRIVACDKNTGVVQFVSKGHWDVFASNPDPKDSTIFVANHDGHIWAIHPVLREGEVGTVVMDLQPEPLAAAR